MLTTASSQMFVVIVIIPLFRMGGITCEKTCLVHTQRMFVEIATITMTDIIVWNSMLKSTDAQWSTVDPPTTKSDDMSSARIVVRLL